MSASQDERILSAAGWHSAEGAAPTPYDRLVDRLGFSLQGGRLIEPPAGAVGFDLSRSGAGTEFELRRALCAAFLESSASEVCHAVDVNHGEWSFTPRDWALTSHFEPFPVPVTPWAEYVAFGDGDFSLGVFCNPRNAHLVVFGAPFVARFSELLRDRLVPASVAAGRPRG